MQKVIVDENLDHVLKYYREINQIFIFGYAGLIGSFALAPSPQNGKMKLFYDPVTSHRTVVGFRGTVSRSVAYYNI